MGGSLGQLDTPMGWTEDDETFFPPLMDSRTPSFLRTKSGVTTYSSNDGSRGSCLRPAVSALKPKAPNATRDPSVRVIFCDGTKGPANKVRTLCAFQVIFIPILRKKSILPFFHSHAKCHCQAEN